MTREQTGLISVIIPVWRDHEALIPLLKRLRSCPEIREIIISTAESAQHPPKTIELFDAIFVENANPNRGRQLNCGAKLATGAWLLFHHADSVLDLDHLNSLAALDPAAASAGAFYRKFDERHPALRFLERFERWHSRAFGTLYGDQSIFVRREHFQRLGGFAPLPLMEDVEFSRRLRRSAKIKLLDPPMSSCAQKQIEQGPWRVTLRNFFFLVLFRCGVPAERLHRWYYPADTQSTHPKSSDVTMRARWQQRWRAFRNPIDREKAQILKERWDSLPPELKKDNQIAGRHLTHCGFILGPSYCSFHCTHCYLPKNANAVPIPSLAEMKEQIETNRRFQGPGGGLQITGGDVADAYWRTGRQKELVEIVRHAVAVGLVPMLMTHGQILIEHPEFLEELVVNGGLRQLAIHIDMTQAGRRAYPIHRVRNETDLHPIREAFTELAHDLRERRNLPLELAHNCTVTERNIDFVPDIVRWFLADPLRSRIWRILSFQPEADTGRTTISKRPVTSKEVWEKICQGIGLQLDGGSFIGGHPDCNQGTILLIDRHTGRLLPLTPTDGKTRRLFAETLGEIGAISTMTTDGNGSGSLFPYRIAGAFAQRPSLSLRLLLRLGALVGSGQIPLGFIRAVVCGHAHTINIGTHNFMDAKYVANADNDPVVRGRLDACVFKGAVKRNGKWEAVPMCAMNQKVWSEVYDARLRNSELQ